MPVDPQSRRNVACSGRFPGHIWQIRWPGRSSPGWKVDSADMSSLRPQMTSQDPQSPPAQPEHHGYPDFLLEGTFILHMAAITIKF